MIMLGGKKCSAASLPSSRNHGTNKHCCPYGNANAGRCFRISRFCRHATLGAALLDFAGKWNYYSEKDLSTNLVTIDSTFFFTHDLIRKYSLPLAW